jgi:hypothetical protein
MIRFKSKYNNKTDDMVFDYRCKKSHTLEHVIVIAKLWNEITKRQDEVHEDLDDNKIYVLVKEILKQEREEDKNGE